MGARRKKRNCPYYADDNNTVKRVRETQMSCRIARVGERELGVRGIYKLSREASRLGSRMGRGLYKLGLQVVEKREREARIAKGKQVPEANTSWGICYERDKLSVAETRRSKVLRACIKSGSRVAVELAIAGKLNKALCEVARVLTG